MDSKCATCEWRKQSEEKPKTFAAWLWRLHLRFCPAWKAYQKELAQQTSSPQASS
jgi:hypothetical protein